MGDDPDGPGSDESSPSSETMRRCSEFSPELQQMMRDTNVLLRSRIYRLECEWEECQMENRVEEMARIEDQIRETTAMMSSGLD